MIKNINNIIKPNPAVIQSGDNTHHQDQSILFNNFNTIKAMVNKPEKPPPIVIEHPRPLLLSLLIILSL
jgi:hypothetical protein